jgi:hypothetical protein
VLNTTVTLTGSAAVALARNPRPNNAVARRAPPNQQYATGEPTVITPQPQADPDQQAYPRQVYPNQQAYPGQQAYPNQQAQRPDDGYIYPADGSTDQQIYPAPRSNRRLYETQANPQPQYRSYNDQGYAQAPQGYAQTPQGYVQAPPGYYTQPRQQYYPPRGNNYQN